MREGVQLFLAKITKGLHCRNAFQLNFLFGMAFLLYSVASLNV